MFQKPDFQVFCEAGIPKNGALVSLKHVALIQDFGRYSFPSIFFIVCSMV